MDKFPVQFENIFFTHQEVRANNQHDAQGNRVGSQVMFEHGLAKLQDRENAYGLQLTVKLDEEKSVNPPYFFAITAYAVFSAQPGEGMDEEKISEAVVTTGMPILVGAIRERLASLTARAPWGTFNLNVIPMAEENA